MIKKKLSLIDEEKTRDLREHVNSARVKLFFFQQLKCRKKGGYIWTLRDVTI